MAITGACAATWLERPGVGGLVLPVLLGLELPEVFGGRGSLGLWACVSPQSPKPRQLLAPPVGLGPLDSRC